MDITVESVLKRTPEQLAGISFQCACGQTHRVEMRKLMLEEGALYKVHELLRELNLGKKAMIVADSSSYAAAGKALADDLAGKGTDVRLSVFPEEQWYADEKALVRVLIDLEPDIELIIAVGSGTINDIARFVSYKAKIPYIVVATAPSMDGYASTGSPILVNGFKKTYSLASPAAIVGDLTVIRQAPRDRQAAGVGDMLAKITALCDWLLASVVEEEHYCEVIAGLMIKALTGIISHVQSIREGEEQATKLLMEGLVLSGIAMQMIGNSRPASGAEHHISHYWEMLHFAAGHRTELHGIKVGAAVPIVLKLYDVLLGTDPDKFRMTAKTAAQIADWERNVGRCYGPLADEMIAMNRGLFLDQSELNIRCGRLVGHWPELKPKLQAILAIAPDVQSLLRLVGAPAEPQEIGVSREQLADALRLAKEVRSRYTVLQLADQLGLLESFAEDMAAAH